MTRDDLTHLANDVLASRRELLDETMTYFPVPGGVITVADSSGLVAEVAFGHAGPDRRTPMETSLLFEIGSISKLFTSLVVNRLVDEERLGLDETVADVVPWIQLGDAGGSVTVSQLLTHTSGLCVGADTLADDAGEIVNSRHCGRASGPTRFHYSNLGYLVLGEMVRARSGRRLNELVAREWLELLKMTHALSEVSQADRASLAVGSWPARPDQPWAPGDPLSPAAFFEVDSASGNIAARGADMAALMAGLIGASRDEPIRDEHGQPVLSASTFRRLTTSLAPSGEPTYTVAGIDPVEESRYGMGINVERINGHFCVSHGGGMVGYSTFMLVDCDAGLGVSVLTNANGDTLASHIVARVIHADLTRRLEGRATAQVTVRAVPATVTPERSGVFISPASGARLEVRRVGDGARVIVDGVEGDLYLLATGRHVTTHAALRRFHLDWFDGVDVAGWTYGEETFLRDGSKPSLITPSPQALSIVGHYRSFSPWFPEFRIIVRAGQLLLVAPGGVEAPSEEVRLVALSDDEYRVGADPWLPERLRVQGRRGREVVSVERDGCIYSRVFSE
jgi:D-alanyl-D-alanine carboxypeptidase